MLLLGARTAGPDSPLDTSPTSSDKPGQFLQQLIQINDSPLQPRTQLTQVNVSSRRLVEIMRLAKEDRNIVREGGGGDYHAVDG